MNRIIIIAIICLSPVLLFAEESDSIIHKKANLEEVVITATRTLRNVNDIPAIVDVIDAKEIEEFPLNNIDDLLKSSANVYVNRSWGVFSKNAAVTMRGLESSARTLVLVDGVPKNRIAGGSVNWHNINPENIDRIEIIKGPASALYGNNAMGGVINIITKKPTKKLEGSIKTYYGTYQTGGSQINLSGAEITNEQGFYWNINGFYRQGDGYVFEPVELLDETDTETYLKEYGSGAKLGYQFNANNSLELVFDVFDETRGAGREVYAEGGSHELYLTNQVKAIYKGKIGEANINAILYSTEESFFGQKEALNSYNEYKLLDSYTDKSDQGFWATYSKKVLNSNHLTFGLEVKTGDVVGKDLYRTSSDKINYNSKMNIFGFFIQNEKDLMNDKLKLIAGIRNDIVDFQGGYQSISNPTKATGFADSFSENFENNQWNALSPKLALQYKLSKKSKLHASVSVGYKPPKLKDLSQTGKIRKGFRLANPNLQPETLTNYELGYSLRYSDKFALNTAIYYSIGTNFQYMIATGDSVDTGGSSLKPVLQSDNVGKVAIKGGEFSCTYNANKNIIITANYSYNHSSILEYKSFLAEESSNLSGKFMNEVSPHLFYGSINWKNKYFFVSANCNYVDEQWYDNENTILIEDYFVANIKISKKIKKQYRIYLDVQNILNNEFIDRKGRLAPGRFIIGGIQYKIN